ncbi:MAG: CBS domain-containing protein [Propionibacteriaceae bacterium]
MRIGDYVEEFPVVGLDTSALVAARLIAQDRRPGIVVAGADGRPRAVLPASQVVKFMVPDYVQSDPALARVMGEVSADKLAERLRRATVADLLPDKPVELAVVNADDTLMEVAAIMARLRSPLCAVIENHRIMGVITAAHLLDLVCGDVTG